MTGRRLALAMGATALVAALVGAAIVLVVQRDGRSAPTRQIVTEEPKRASEAVSPEGAELVALLEKGRSLTFHARYTGSTEDPAAQGSEMRLALWRRPPMARQDSEVTAGDKVARSAAFLLPSGVVACSQAGGPWECRHVTQAPPETEGLLGMVTEQLKGRVVEARDETVAGRPVRCFELTKDRQVSEICATKDGVPVRVSGGSSRLELVELSYEVPDEIFLPPGPVAPASS